MREDIAESLACGLAKDAVSFVVICGFIAAVAVWCI